MFFHASIISRKKCSPFSWSPYSSVVTSIIAIEKPLWATPPNLVDRYEIHIQAFVDFINGKLIICQSSSPQKYFEKYILKIFQQKQHIFRNNGGYAFQKNETLWIFRFSCMKIICSNDHSTFFLISLKGFGSN